MKLSEIQVGGRYQAKVSQRLVTVRVTHIDSFCLRDRQRTMITAVSEATGRYIRIRSPQRLRSKVEDATNEAN